MGDKYDEKLEKKRRKAEYKLQKKQLKEKYESAERKDETSGTADTDKTTIQVVLPKEEPKPWYKNPNWIRALASVATLIIVLITFYLTFYH
jgi:hypothetical protein